MKKRAALFSGGLPVVGLLFILLLTMFSACEVSGVEEPAPEGGSGSVTVNKLPPPQYSVAGGVSTTPLTVTLSSEVGGDIYYYLRVDGHTTVEPDAGEWLPYGYTNIEVGVELPRDELREQLFTIWSYVEKDGERSDPVREFYRITGKIHLVIEIRSDADFPGKSRAIVISYPNNANKKFTLDGRSIPSREKGNNFTSGPEELDKAILIDSVDTIQAFAYLSGWEDSDVVTAETVLSIEKAGFSPNNPDRIYNYGTPLTAYSTLSTADIFYKEYPFSAGSVALIPEDRTAAEGVIPAANRAAVGDDFKTLTEPIKVAVRGFSRDGRMTPSRCDVLEFKVKLPPTKITEVAGSVSEGEAGAKIVDDTELKVELALDSLDAISGSNFYYTLLDDLDAVPESGVTEFRLYTGEVLFSSTKKLVVFTSKATSPTKTHDPEVGENGWVDSVMREQKYLFELMLPTINLTETVYNNYPDKLIIENVGTADKVYFTINSSRGEGVNVVDDPDRYIYKLEGGRGKAKKIGDPDSEYKEIVLNGDDGYFPANSEGNLVLEIQTVKEVSGGADILSPTFRRDFSFELKSPEGFHRDIASAGDRWLDSAFNLSIRVDIGDIMFKELVYQPDNLFDAGILAENSGIEYERYEDSSFYAGGREVNKTRYFAFQVTRRNWKPSEELVKRYIFRPGGAMIIHRDNPEGALVDGSEARPYKEITEFTLECGTFVDTIYYTLKDTSAITGYPTKADIDNVIYGFVPLTKLSIDPASQRFEKLPVNNSGTLSYVAFKEGWEPSELNRESFSFKAKSPKFYIENGAGVRREVVGEETFIASDERLVVDLDYPAPLKNNYSLNYVEKDIDGVVIGGPTVHSMRDGVKYFGPFSEPVIVAVKAERELSLPSEELSLKCTIQIEKVDVTVTESADFTATKFISKSGPHIVEVGGVEQVKYLYELKDRPLSEELKVIMQSPAMGSYIVKYQNSASVTPLAIESYFNISPRMDIYVTEAGTKYTAWVEDSGSPDIRSPKVEAIFDFKVAAPQFSGTAGVDEPDSGIVDPAARVVEGDTLELSCPTIDTKVGYTLTYNDDADISREVTGIVEKDADNRYFITGLPEVSPLTITMEGMRTDTVDGRDYTWVNSDEVTTVFYRKLPKPTIATYITTADDGTELESLTPLYEDVDRIILKSSVPAVIINRSVNGTVTTEPVSLAPDNSLPVDIPFESPVKVNYYAKRADWINSDKLWTLEADALTFKRRLKVTTFETMAMGLDDSSTYIKIESNAPGTTIKYGVTEGLAPERIETYGGEIPVNSSQIVRVESLEKAGWLPALPADFPAPIEIYKCPTPEISIDRSSELIYFNVAERDAKITYKITALNVDGMVEESTGELIYRGLPLSEPFLKVKYDRNIRVTAYATKVGLLKSAEATKDDFKWRLSKPVLWQTGFNNDSRQITLKFAPQPEGGEIYWRQGADPVVGNPAHLYTADEGLPITTVGQIRAVAVKDGWESAVMDPVAINLCAAPTIRRERGTGSVIDIGIDNKIEINSSTVAPGLVVEYQKRDVGGSWPTSWTPYVAAFVIERNSQVRARVAAGSSEFYIPSLTSMQTYYVRLAQPTRIEVARNGDGQITRARFFHTDTGLSLSYNINGQTGSVFSGDWVDIRPEYYNRDSLLNISVVAVRSGFTDSPARTVSPRQRVAKPVITLGSVSGGRRSLNISCSTPGRLIYYTEDGSNPTAASTSYGPGATVPVSATVKAIAVITGWDNSLIAE